MDQSPDRRDPVGPDFRGPDFQPWAPAPDRAPFTPLPPQLPPPWGPATPAPGARPAPRPGSRRPAIITATVVFIVAAVVAGGTAVAHYDDTHIAAPQPVAQPMPPANQGAVPSPATSADDRIDFLTSEGTGELILVDWSWSPRGRMPPASGDYLQVQVELVCSSGVVDYGPEYFQVFDNTGRLVEVTAEGTDGPELDVGTLEVGERVRGMIAFDLARGDATLLMSDSLNQTVTALRIPQ